MWRTAPLPVLRTCCPATAAPSPPPPAPDVRQRGAAPADAGPAGRARVAAHQGPADGHRAGAAAPAGRAGKVAICCGQVWQGGGGREARKTTCGTRALRMLAAPPASLLPACLPALPHVPPSTSCMPHRARGSSQVHAPRPLLPLQAAGAGPHRGLGPPGGPRAGAAGARRGGSGCGIGARSPCPCSGGRWAYCGAARSSTSTSSSCACWHHSGGSSKQRSGQQHWLVPPRRHGEQPGGARVGASCRPRGRASPPQAKER